jgi:cell wall-associated NlpC family hydrolase
MTATATREAVLQEARTWIGTPFRHQAMVKQAGVGCGTFLIGVYGACGFPVPKVDELGHFSKDWHFHKDQERYLAILQKFTKEVGAPQVADIILFRMGRAFSHSGIIVEWPKIIHANCAMGVGYADALRNPQLANRQMVFLSPFEN